MTNEEFKKFQEALATLRDPDGTGKTKMFIGTKGKMKPVLCLKVVNNNVCKLNTGHRGYCIG